MLRDVVAVFVTVLLAAQITARSTTLTGRATAVRVRGIGKPFGASVESLLSLRKRLERNRKILSKCSKNRGSEWKDASTHIEPLKTRLFGAIAARPQVTQDILSAIESIEREGGQCSDFMSISGRWSLVYSTQTTTSFTMAQSQQQQQAQDLIDSVIQGSTAALYRFFFKFAPALAGAQEQDRDEDLRDFFGGGVKNEQIVDIEKGLVSNKVQARFSKNGPSLKINVVGECTPSNDSMSNLQVIFTEFSVEIPWTRVGLVTVPLPRPRGALETTFCDENLRISRGGRGGIFVLKRLRPN